MHVPGIFTRSMLDYDHVRVLPAAIRWWCGAVGSAAFFHENHRPGLGSEDGIAGRNIEIDLVFMTGNFFLRHVTALRGREGKFVLAEIRACRKRLHCGCWLLQIILGVLVDYIFGKTIQ